MALLLAGCPIPPVDNGPGDVVPPPPGLAPGLIIDVVEVLFPDDGRPEVIFNLTDSENNEIPLGELTDARFILGYLDTPEDGGTAHYFSYNTRIEDPDGTPGNGDEALQATYDGARLDGITRNDDGTFTYKFDTDISAEFDPSLPHQIAGQFERFFIVDGQEYPYNLAQSFMPDGSKQLDTTREIVDTETCNTCHTRLAVHGGVRREVQLCIMCHSPQSSDAQSGNSVGMAEMIHKIHHGANLPSVQAGEPYQIVGFRNTVHDYSEVHFPQDIRNCTACHSNAPQAEAYLNEPTLNGCASCHDRTWFGNPSAIPAGFTQHTGGQQPNNNLCSLCHTPTGPSPSPIMEAHTREVDRPEAPGLGLDVLAVETMAVEGGHALEVTFEATDKNGDRYTDLSGLASAGLLVAYPASDYQNVLSESVLGSEGLTANADGTFTYAFDELLPDMDVSFAVAMQGRLRFEFRGETFTQGTSTNGLMFFTLDGGAPTPRRMVVSDAKCSACHGEIRFHGDQRFGVDSCLMCHNANATDANRRPDEELPPETVNFKDMIHRIHRGADLDGDYTVYGFGNRAHDFTEIVFPGLVQECSICHEDGTEQLPLAADALPTTVTQGEDIIEQILAERAACTSCHDGIMPNVHALLQTDVMANIESCAVCHGPDASSAVALVHALAP